MVAFLFISLFEIANSLDNNKETENKKELVNTTVNILEIKESLEAIIRTCTQELRII